MKRLLWRVQVAWIFYWDQLGWAWKEFRRIHQSPRCAWQYSRGLASDQDMIDELTPRQAFDEDRTYWEG